ncbi:MAG: hypothetical protein R3A52_32670 [Polyangiales bacterium]
MGETRGARSVSIVGTDAFDVWIAAGRLYRWRGMVAEVVRDDEWSHLAVDPQRRVLGVNDAEVARWDAAGAAETRPCRSSPLGINFDRVHAGQNGAPA